MPGEAKALLTTFIWAVTTIILTNQTRRIGTLSLNVVRTLLAAAFLLIFIPFSGAAGELRQMSAATALSMVGSGLLAFAAGDSLYFLALRALGAALAVPIAEAAYPLLTFLLAWVWLGESFSTALLLGAAFVVAGILLLTGGRGDPPAGARPDWRLGLPLVFVAPFFWALSTVWLRAGAADLGPAAASVLRVVPVAFVLLPVAYRSPAGLQLRRYRLTDLLGIAIIGVLGMGVTSLLYVGAIEDIGASRTAILTATVPLFTLPMAVVFLGERLTLRVVLGTLICTAGILFIV